MSWLGLFSVAVGAALVAGALLAWRLRAWPSPGRFLAALLPLALVALAGRLGQTVLEAPNFDWAGARLMPLLTWVQDGTLYQPATGGPVYNTIYAPLSYLVYTPALLANDPAGVVMAGAALGLACYLGPVLGLCLASPRSRPQVVMGLLAFVLFGLVSYHSRALRMSIEGTIHDAPSVGLGALACLVAYLDRQGRCRWLSLSALLAVLAIWSKQVMAPLALTLPLWTLWTHGRRRALIHAGWTALWGGASLGVVLLLDRETFWFNVVTLPSCHPWCASFPRCLLAVGYHGYQELWLVVAAVVFLAILERPWREPSRRRWLLFALVGLAQLPTAFLGRVKLGGSANSFTPVLYFLLLALAAYLLDRLREQGDTELGRAIRVGFAVAVGGLTGLQLLSTADFLKDYPGLSRSREMLVTDYLRKHPGRAWFPWNPLPHRHVEGRACHFAYGLFDRELGGFPLDDHHFRQHVPPDCRLICFPPGRRGHRCPACLERLLREYPRRVEVEELPGFECYERPP